MRRRIYDPSDFEKVCQFLYDLYKRENTINHWLPTRFENGHLDKDETYYLWEKDGDLIGVLTSERKHRFLNSEDEHCIRAMLDFLSSDEGIVCCTDTNVKLQLLLRKYLYQPERADAYIRIHDPAFTQATESLPSGYRFQELTKEYYSAYAEAIRVVFGHQFFDEGVVEYLQTRSFWNQELDLLVVNEDNNIASFCTLRIDPVYHLTELEPLGTTPSHRGKGLAKSIILELLDRHTAFTSDLIYIGGAANTPAANAVYEATGFTEKIEEWLWLRIN